MDRKYKRKELIKKNECEDLKKREDLEGWINKIKREGGDNMKREY